MPKIILLFKVAKHSRLQKMHIAYKKKHQFLLTAFTQSSLTVTKNTATHTVTSLQNLKKVHIEYQITNQIPPHKH